MKIGRRSIAFVFAWAMLVPACAARAQSGGAIDYAPLPDPGYGLYYHDAQGAPNAATR
jgi:hypothetical protein